MTVPLAAPAPPRTCPHTPPCPHVLGADLHEGSVVVDAANKPHTIDHFREYPGLRLKSGETKSGFIGDHARIAYDADETWRCTIADHEHFHCLPEECRDEHESR